MTETAGREGGVILPFSLLPKLLPFMNEMNTLTILILDH